MPEVTVIGSITADLTAFSESLPVPGETVLGTDFSFVLGGKGANQAIASARAGAQTAIIGCVGKDIFSQPVMRGLEADGIDVRGVRAVDGPTGVAHIRVDSSGENDIVMVPLANSSISENDVDHGLADASDDDVLMLQLEIPAHIASYSARQAHQYGMKVVLDPAPAIALADDVWPLISIVTPNEIEATQFTGINVTDSSSAFLAGQWFIDRGVETAIITLASKGVAVLTGAHRRHYAAFPVVVGDTTAAGDAFVGYLAAGLAQGRDLEDAIRFGMAAGALAVTRRGASSSLPSRADTEALLHTTPTSPREI